MQITSARSSNLLATQLSLQEARSRDRLDAAIAPVTRRNSQRDASQNEVEERAEVTSKNTDLAVERKLANIGRVQFAFSAALKLSQNIENDYLLEPII